MSFGKPAIVCHDKYGGCEILQRRTRTDGGEWVIVEAHDEDGASMIGVGIAHADGDGKVKDCTWFDIDALGYAAAREMAQAHYDKREKVQLAIFTDRPK